MNIKSINVDDQSKLILNTTNLALPTGRAAFFKAREREAPSEMRSEQIFQLQAANYVSCRFLLSRVLRF